MHNYPFDLIFVLKLCVPFSREDSELAVSILENMTKVPRFDMLMMCISTRDRSGELKFFYFQFLLANGTVC